MRLIASFLLYFLHMTKSNIFKKILFLIMIFLEFLLLIFLFRNEDIGLIIENIKSFGIFAFLGFVILSLINFSIYTVRWMILLKASSKEPMKLRFYTVFMDRMAGFAGSYLTPAAQVGGEPVRIAMLSMHGIPVPVATKSVLLDMIFDLFFYVLFIMLGLVFAMNKDYVDSRTLIILIASIAALLFVLITIKICSDECNFHPLRDYVNRDGKKGVLRNTIFEIVNIGKSLKELSEKNVKAFRIVTFLSLTSLIFRVFEVFYIAFFFGFILYAGDSFLIATIPGIALLMPVPGGIGLFEGGLVELFSLLSLPISALSFALIIRARDIVFILIGVVYASIEGKRLSSDSKKI